MLKNYLKIAFKVLLRRKFYTFISLAGISLTLMILIVYTAFFENMLGSMPPETNHDKTLCVFGVKLSKENSGMTNSHPGYLFLTEYIRIHTLPHIECASVFSVPEPVETVCRGRLFKMMRRYTDSNYWKILEFSFLEGEPFTADDVQNGNFVAVINNSMRKKMFGRGKALGETIIVDGREYRVAGVVRDVSSLRQIPYAEVWIPVTTSKTDAYRNDGAFGLFNGMVLAKDRSVIPAIQDEYRTRVERLDYPVPNNYDTAQSRIMTYSDYMTRQVASGGHDTDEDPSNMLLATIVGVMLLFMVLPTLNLTNINLSRIYERSSEIGVRKAFGASSYTLVGQFLTENVVLTCLGGVIGFVLSFIILHAINGIRIVPGAILQFNGRIFLYGFAVTLVFGIVSGVYPAWKMSRSHPVKALGNDSL